MNNLYNSVKKEYEYLLAIANDIDYDDTLYTDLYNVNKKLWDIEDRIRLKESMKEFDNHFIELARSVYITNDLRSQIKNKINISLQSNFIEVKSYKKYT